ncbi:hypothetical protein MMC18_004761 [Xylographa bjoerkii]|nr:hypothetical protein [Xylographa bjoerkii]
MSYDTETKAGTEAAGDGVADIMCTLVVGEERHEFLVKKDYLMDIEYFKCALKDGCWKEGKDNRIELPEDNPEIWKLAVEFITTGEFRPYVSPTCDCIIGEGWCHDPMFDPPVEVIDADDVTVAFNMADDQVGDWGYPDITLVTLETLVGVFCLANKYLWYTLLCSCMEKLRLFPMGPAALPVLAVTVGERDWPLRYIDSWDEGLCDEYHQLVEDTFRYHAVRYDGGPVDKTYTLEDCTWMELFDPYEALKEFLKANMTAEAWKAFNLLEDNRAERREKFHERMDAQYWECSHDRQGVCVVAWDKHAYDQARPCYLKGKQDAWLRGSEGALLQERASAASQAFWKTHNETCFCKNMSFSGRTDPQYLKEHHAKMKDASDNFLDIMEEKLVTEEKGRTNPFDTQPFAAAEPGDFITEIKDDVPGGHYVTGLVLRTNTRGWFPRSALRLFEQRSRKHCNGPCCEPQTFKYDGCRIYLDDPLSEGIKLRKGRKSRGWRRTGGPMMAGHKRTVASVGSIQGDIELHSDSLWWLDESIW